MTQKIHHMRTRQDSAKDQIPNNDAIIQNDNNTQKLNKNNTSHLDNSADLTYKKLRLENVKLIIGNKSFVCIEDNDEDMDAMQCDILCMENIGKIDDDDESSAYDECDDEHETILERYTSGELDYFYSLDQEARDDILKQELEIDKLENTEKPLRFKILTTDMDMKLKSIVIQKMNSMAEMDSSSGEYSKLSSYIKSVTRLPIGKYKSLPLALGTIEKQVIGDFLTNAQSLLDESIYGQKEIKKQFIMMLAKWISNPSSKGLVLGIEGPPGVGKTTLIKEGLCKALSLPYAFIPLGGANDAAFLDGHSFTYEGSMYGRIADSFMTCGCMNPVLCFDELDKVADNYRGNEIFNVLTHVTDYTQNDMFYDKYFAEIPLDLSRSIMVFTYNDASKIPAVLKDRMICLRTTNYSTSDKITIIENFMLPKILQAHGLSKDDVLIDKSLLVNLITTSSSKGMRDVKREIECIVSNINMLRMLPDDLQATYLKEMKLNQSQITLPFIVNTRHLQSFLKELKSGENGMDYISHMYL